MNRLKIYNTFSVTCFIFWLTACASIPITSIPKLAALKPQTLDLSKSALAVRVNKDFRVYRDGTTIRMQVEGPTLEEPLKIELQLEASTLGLTPFLDRKSRDGSRIVLFEVSDADRDQIAAFHSKVASLSENSESSGRNTSTLNARTTGCLEPGTNPFRDFRMEIYFRSSPEDSFFTLIKDTKILSDGTGSGGVGYCVESDQDNLL